MDFSSAPLNDSSSGWIKHWKQITDEFKPDREVDTWFLMGSPWPMMVILLLYLQFVLKSGPEMMKNRPPLKLRGLIIFYNTFQICLNGALFFSCFGTPGFVSYVWRECCRPTAVAVSPQEAAHLLLFNRGSWWFLMAKVLDLLDTVFFVLNKKNSHISFLHVYHHSSMMLTVWFGFKYIRPLHSTLPGVLNALIHVIMYTYYLVSILSPGIGKKYIRMKMIVTRLQIVQFVVILAHCTAVYMNCPVPRSIIYLLFFHVTAFLILFLNFYIKQYIIKKGNNHELKSSTKKVS
ncbi:unnamed protein product [Bemisia tabaci]|uniref:Elongation of very long chain fatty acids protein n=1 Tax=Bemisia tabaci TaxID=7038 RepID=A0A9P0F621_BEMTA|nr:PREDICTED: elongation of very long chain fatty acids protein 4-like [Bemisia tabaci]XP_018900431.1 PREDICTED: elongation of very long chain fatty acids protein 4-like [Bemisia tabaci]CAH0391218.1 unnamed protein product [Bemisia tabaci]